MSKNRVESLSSSDIEELALNLCGNDYDYDHGIEDGLYEKFDLSLEQFEKIVRVLFARIDVGISPLTNEAYIGFSDVSENAWLAKKTITSKFIGLVVLWSSDCNHKSINENGFQKDIISNGECEYEVIIRKPKKP